MHVASFFMAVIIMLFILLVLSGSVSNVYIVVIGLILLLIAIALLISTVKSSSEEIAMFQEEPQFPWPIKGSTCEVLDEITPSKPGYVRCRGELWKAYSLGPTFKKGDTAIVVEVRDTYLLIDRIPKTI